MNDFDQLFKKLLTTFFSDLLTLVRPPLAQRVLPHHTSFARTELFSRVLRGQRRHADLVARVALDEQQSTWVLTHVEVESRARSNIGERLWRYNMMLQLREELPVFPVVIFLTGGPAGLEWRSHEVKVLDDVICQFRYLSLGISAMDAEALLSRDQPLAWALAAYARHPRGKARLKLSCLKRIAAARLDDQTQLLLFDAVHTGLQLKGEDAVAYQHLLESEKPAEVIMFETTWSGQIARKARLEGKKEGKKEGRQEGRQEGRHAVLKRLLARRFGPLPARVVERLEAIRSPEDLDDLAERLLTASSLEELGLA